MEYSRLCAPLKASLEKVTELKREIEQNEQTEKEKLETVNSNIVSKKLASYKSCVV